MQNHRNSSRFQARAVKLGEQRCKSGVKMLSTIAIFYWNVKREIKPSILLSNETL